MELARKTICYCILRVVCRQSRRDIGFKVKMCIKSFHNSHTYQLVCQNVWHTKNYNDCALSCFWSERILWIQGATPWYTYREKKNRVSQFWDTMDSRHIFTSKTYPGKYHCSAWNSPKLGIIPESCYSTKEKFVLFSYLQRGNRSLSKVFVFASMTTSYIPRSFWNRKYKS